MEEKAQEIIDSISSENNPRLKTKPFAEKPIKILDKTIDHIFSLKKSTLYLLLIFFLGFVLRFIAARNLSVMADDMHFVTHAINFFQSGRLTVYDTSSGLWYAFTSIIYKFLGTTQIASRFGDLIFGSLTVLLVYLLSKEFFNKKISLISAFLAAIGTYQIKETIAQMDNMALFFVLLSVVLFIMALKKERISLYALSGISLGLGIYTKVYPLLFIPSLLLYFAYFKIKEKEKLFSKQNVKFLIVFLFCIFIFCIPVLTHNYLLYKDKGFLDMQFTRTTGLGKNISAEFYAWDYQFTAKNDWKGLIFGNSEIYSTSNLPLLLIVLDFFLEASPLIFLLSIFGIALILTYHKKYKDYLVLVFLLLLVVVPFMASIILLSKHFVYLEIFCSPFAGFAIFSISKFLKKKYNKDYSKYILVFCLLFSIIFLGLPSSGVPHFYGKSAVAQLIDFKNEHIPENSLMVSDSRIYRGRIHWTSINRPYLEANEFLQLTNQQESLPGRFVNAEIYYIECLKDDCGWGTIKNQPELNQSMEELAEFFKQNSELAKTIKVPNPSKAYFPIIFSNNQQDSLAIYKATLPIKDSILAQASKSKNWFLYNIGFSQNEFDSYSIYYPIDMLLNKFARGTLIFALMLVFLSPFYIIYLIRKNETNNNHAIV